MKLYSHLFVVLPVLLGFCAKQETKDSLARIGNSIISKDQYEAFQKVIRIYPSKQNDFFPGKRTPITYMVESEMLYSNAPGDLKAKVEKSADWKWKKNYYPAQFYLMENLASSLGYSDEQLNAYYSAHKDSFKTTIKAPDSTKKDSTFVKSFIEVKEEIANILFLKDNKPDPAFLKTQGDTLPAQAVINQNWISYVRSNIPVFFMKKYYKEDFGKPYPDSISDVFGKGKAITPEDMNVILTWIPEERREYFNNKEGQKELVEWLLKWKLFSAHAEKSGFTKTPLIKEALDWASKIEVVQGYVGTVLVPKANKSPVIDTLMVKYSLSDESGTANLKVDSALLAKSITDIKTQTTGLSVDSIIYDLRKNAKIKFFQNDFRDEKAEDPTVLIHKADSLRDSAKTDEAESIYTSLANDFPFSPEGKRSLIESAKILTERQSYTQAISNYRKFLICGNDPSKFCNLFFMIGFIYDEYLDRPELAELNYKYVLKNTPGCELTDDAEFMMLHLGEPMSSVEELQAEALRQGRKVETAETNPVKQK